MKNTFFFIMCCGVIFSCINNNKIPAEIIPPKEMQEILWDVIRAEALSAEFARKDSTLNEVAETKVLTQKVFEIHKIDSALFDKSYKWYTSHPDVMKIIFDSLNTQNQRENIMEIKERSLPLKIDSLKKIRLK